MNSDAEKPTAVIRPERYHIVVAVVMLLLMLVPALHAVAAVGVGADLTGRPATSGGFGLAAPQGEGELPTPVALAILACLLIPVGYLVWVFRARTEVSEAGIATRRAFRAGASVPWENIKGIGFQRSRTFLRTDAGDVALPCVSFNTVPLLAEASRGRIPDVLTTGRDAADDKVRVVKVDGSEVLMTHKEYRAYAEKHQLPDFPDRHQGASGT